MLKQEDIDFLNTISEIADMGVEGTKQVISKTDDITLKNTLQEQLKGHNDLYGIVQKMLHYENVEAKQASSLSKMQSQIVSSFKTMTSDNPASSIAEMIIQGNTTGNVELTKKIHEYKGDNLEIKVLAQQYMQTQMQYVDVMKTYL